MRPFALGATPPSAGSGSGFTPSIRTVTGNTTLGSTDNTVRVNTTSGNVTITLPTGSTYQGIVYNIKKVASANTVTISSANNIDGQSSISLTANYASVSVQYDNTSTTWNII